ncbi:energy coupling factor transporter S component ThiW [Aneurinibacillus terranovensis]|uniref:energy coupling factor transporter S component ThiW n=1 Tax=Aneurinibacillus terranovensis TaxID=278991 RepID=UPI00048986F7|nr:energy coupling factor transporter S component ThiW [Aneurinibacillus terranovensis]
MNPTTRLALMALLVAIGTVGSSFLWFPVGIAKVDPLQHAINVIAAVLLGPGPAVAIAFLIGLIRNMLGVGTILAFPGGMVGAWLAGYLFTKIRKTWAAAVGEVIGTGVIGSLLSVPIAGLLMGKKVGALFYVPSFFISSFAGAILGMIFVPILLKQRMR